MGTFLYFNGEQKIPKEKLEEYVERVKKILKEGGMVQFEQVKLFNKEINLIKDLEIEDNGKIYFHYNIFSDEAWETACFNTLDGKFVTNKVGWTEFNWVCTAVYILAEFYNETFCITDENGELEDVRQVIGWLNYLFDENYKNTRYYDLWKIYDLLRDDCYTPLSVLLNYIDNEYDIKLSSLVAYAYVNQEDSLWETFSKIEPEEGSFNLINCIRKSEQFVKKFKNEGKTSDDLINCLLKDNENIKKISLDNTNEYNAFAFHIMVMPSVIILKQICDEYKLDFWETYDNIKEKINFSRGDIWDHEKGDNETYKISTKDFLDTSDNSLYYWHTKFKENYHKQDDDFCYFWTKDSKYEFTDEFNEWIKELKNDFKKINESKREMLSETNFIEKMIDLLNLAENEYERIFAYKEMFYEFLANSQTKEYQSAIILFEKILKDNKELGSVIKERSSWDISDRNILFNKGRLHVKRYLAIMANKELRRKIFNF